MCYVKYLPVFTGSLGFDEIMTKGDNLRYNIKDLIFYCQTDIGKT